MEEIIVTLNSVLANPNDSEIRSLFEPESFIRLNHIFFGPSQLPLFKTYLESLGLVSLEIVQDGLMFNFQKTFIHFKGNYEIYSRAKIFSFELNFESYTSTEEGRLLMVNIEQFLRKCDAMFFMTYPINIDATILQNPLSNSVGYLARRINDD